MKRDTKLLLIVIGIIVVAFIFFRPKGDTETRVEIESPSEDLGDIFAEAESTLAEGQPQAPVEKREPNNPYLRRSDYDRSDRDFDYETNPYEDTAKKVITVKDTSESASEDTSGGSDERRRDQEDSVRIQKEIEAEKEKARAFIEGLFKWLNTNRTATQSRARAYEIEQDAERIRKEADQAEAHLKPLMVERADLMDKYATRLSATRSNDYKIRILMQDLEKELEK